MLALLSTLLLSSLLTLLPLSAAQSGNSSVFVYKGDDNAEVVFALQADKGNGDLYFHLSGPSSNQWVGVGIGGQMAGSLMLIAYAGSNKGSVTISPRLATGETEPTYQEDIEIQTSTNGGSSSDSDSIIAQGVCKGCVHHTVTPLDLTSDAQAFIFAVGPPFPPVHSDSLSAGLTEHSFVGHFTMKMPAATVDGGGSVPQGPFTTSVSASQATNTQTTFQPAPHIHGLVMSFVFLILFPFGSLLLRVWNKVKGHAIVQVIGLVLFCMAFAGGVVVSGQYNRSKDFTNPHQIIGILILIALWVQLGLGIMHHRIFKKEQRKTIRGWIHLYMGPIIIFFGLLNGILGFVLAESPFLAAPYTIFIIIFGAIYSCIRFWSWRRRRRAQAYKDQQQANYIPPFGSRVEQQGSQQQFYSQGRGTSQPPPYGQDVPLQRYHSDYSVPHVGMEPQEPRPMV